MQNNLVAKTAVTIDAPASVVWKAITTPSIIKLYLMGTDVESDWKEGSPITYRGEYNGKSYHDKGTIKKMVKNKLFESTYWSSMSGTADKPENYKVVTYELAENDGATSVTLLQDNNHTEQEQQQAIKNWEPVLQKLKTIVEKNKNENA